jgi:hypothetical protein
VLWLAIRAVLDEQAVALRARIDQAGAGCWLR